MHSTPWPNPPSTDTTRIGTTYQSGAASTRSCRKEPVGITKAAAANAPSTAGSIVPSTIPAPTAPATRASPWRREMRRV